MLFPERPTCHDDNYQSRVYENGSEWRPPMVKTNDGASSFRDFPYRSCSFCGCIHPEDLIKYLEQGAKLELADQKYGWPHKFYVKGIPSGLPVGEPIEVGNESRPVKETDDVESLKLIGARFYEHMGTKRVDIPKLEYVKAGRTAHGKFYNEHLNDAGFDPGTLQKLLDLLTAKGPVRWFLRTGRVAYALK